MNAAQVILQQLGGNKFRAMTGAKNLLCSSTMLQFDLPARLAKSGINKVQVHLDDSDTYTVKCFKLRGFNCPQVAEESMVYADCLQSTFTKLTGLDTSL